LVGSSSRKKKTLIPITRVDEARSALTGSSSRKGKTDVKLEQMELVNPGCQSFKKDDSEFKSNPTPHPPG
jgi:hypothetical protein